MGTDYLFARPSFISGMAGAMDMSGTLVKEYNRSATVNLADYLALKSDWAISGLDLFMSMERFNETHGKD